MSAGKRVAIPTFGTRVSPRFDCARAILVVAIDDGKPTEREEFTASGWAPHERIDKLLELGVDTVVCGGIDRWSAESLQSAGVTVYGWVTGEIDGALAALLRGDLDSEAMMEAGGRRGCRRFRRNDGVSSQLRGSQQDVTLQGRRGRRHHGGGADGGPGPPPDR
jgi:predicted Fe-Mo cluster-binding NifX family protein